MFLERERELRSVAAAVTRASRGQGGVVIVRGPPGIGRTSVLAGITSWIATAGGVAHPTPLRAAGATAEQHFAHGVSRQLMDPYLPVRAHPAADGADGTGRPPGGEAPAGPGMLPAGLRRAHDRLVSEAGSLPDGCAQVLLVDDVDLSDDPSLRYLHHLASGIRQRRIVLVCSHADGRVSSDRALVRDLLALAQITLPLARLSPTAVGAVVQDWAGGTATPAFMDACHHLSRGNPFLLTALLAASDRQRLPRGTCDPRLLSGLRPAQVRRLVQRSLEGQDESVLAVARAVAVLAADTEEQVTEQQVKALTGLDLVSTGAAVWRLRQLDLMPGSGALALRDAVVREVICQSAPTAELDRLHLAAAAVKHRQGSDMAAVAAHLMAVSTPLTPQARDTLRRAAELAVQSGDAPAAARYLRRVLHDAALDDADRAGLLLELARAERSFAVGAAERHVHQAIPALATAAERAEAIMVLAPDHQGWAGAGPTDTIPPIGAALGDPTRLSGGAEQLALRFEAWVRRWGDSDPAELSRAVTRWDALPERLVRPADAGPGGRQLLAVLAQAVTARVHCSADRVARIAADILGCEPATAGHVHTVLPVLVDCCVAADALDDLLPWLETAHHDAERRGGTVERAAVRAELALVRLGQGRHVVARELIVSAAGTDEEPLPRRTVTVLVTVALRTGDLALGAEVLRSARPELSHPVSAAALTLLGGAQAAWRGDHALAAELCLDAGHVLNRAGWSNPALLPWAGLAVRSLLAGGDRDRATAVSRRELVLARRWGAPHALGQALMTRALLDHQHAEAFLREACEVLEASPDLHTRAMALLALAERTLDTAPLLARSSVDRARDLAEECESAPLRARASDLLDRSAGRMSPARLTAAERTVAELAVQGLSNQAIADRLGVTRRAVEKHLTNCYRKTSSTGRAELAWALGGAEGPGATSAPDDGHGRPGNARTEPA